jgi:hypothetical protein
LTTGTTWSARTARAAVTAVAAIAAELARVDAAARSALATGCPRAACATVTTVAALTEG